VKHDLVDYLYFDTQQLDEMVGLKERVKNYSLAEKYYLEGTFSNNIYGEPLLALNMLTQAIDLVPDDYRYREEAASINLALTRQPHLPEAQLLAHLDNAIEHLEVMVQRHPTSAFDWNNLGFVYMNRGVLDKAEDAFRRAIERQPEYPLPHIYLASVFAGRGDAGAAEDELFKALDYFPHEMEALYRLGILYLVTNRFSDAQDAFEKIVKIDPDYRDVAARLKTLNDTTK
jgi:cytochrome c-type biogenesis protein CcmH/NrfG